MLDIARVYELNKQGLTRLSFDTSNLVLVKAKQPSVECWPFEMAVAICLCKLISSY